MSTKGGVGPPEISPVQQAAGARTSVRPRGLGLPTAPAEPPRRRRRRPYVRSGFGTLQRLAQTDEASWIEALGAVGEALKEWRARLVADLGGEDTISAQEKAVIELASKTYLLLESIDRWLLAQPSLINKSRRALFPVVLQRQQLGDALARYMTMLGLARRAKRIPTLGDYVREKYGAPAASDGGGPGT